MEKINSEYKVVLRAGLFDYHTGYVTAESAQEIKKELENKFAYEMEFEGLRIVNISKV